MKSAFLLMRTYLAASFELKVSGKLSANIGMPS
jgi:hypothetical protein